MKLPQRMKAGVNMAVMEMEGEDNGDGDGVCGSLDSRARNIRCLVLRLTSASPCTEKEKARVGQQDQPTGHAILALPLSWPRPPSLISSRAIGQIIICCSTQPLTDMWQKSHPDLASAAA